MKKSSWTLVLLLVLGIIAAAIVTGLVSSIPSLGFLTKSADIRWEPKADLQVIKYDLMLQVKLNLLSVIGIATGIWIYRKL